MKKYILIVIFILALLGIVGWAWLYIQSRIIINNLPQQTVNPDGYTAQDVALHATREDCWMIVHDKVYNITPFVSVHPGGSIIASGCGKDSTSMFEDRPNNEGAHSQRARTILQKLYIGELKS